MILHRGISHGGGNTVVNIHRWMLTKSPSARLMVLTNSAARLMDAFLSSKAIVPQMKIALRA